MEVSYLADKTSPDQLAMSVFTEERSEERLVDSPDTEMRVIVSHLHCDLQTRHQLGPKELRDAAAPEPMSCDIGCSPVATLEHVNVIAISRKPTLASRLMLDAVAEK